MVENNKGMANKPTGFLNLVTKANAPRPVVRKPVARPQPRPVSQVQRIQPKQRPQAQPRPVQRSVPPAPRPDMETFDLKIWDNGVNFAIYFMFIVSLLIVSHFFEDIIGGLIAALSITLFIYIKHKLYQKGRTGNNLWLGILFTVLLVLVFISNIVFGAILLISLFTAFYQYWKHKHQYNVIIHSIVNFMCFTFAITITVILLMIFTYVILPLLNGLHAYIIALIGCGFLVILFFFIAYFLHVNFFGIIENREHIFSSFHEKVNWKRILVWSVVFAGITSLILYGIYFLFLYSTFNGLHDQSIDQGKYYLDLIEEQYNINFFVKNGLSMDYETIPGTMTGTDLVLLKDTDEFIWTYKNCDKQTYYCEKVERDFSKEFYQELGLSVSNDKKYIMLFKTTNLAGEACLMYLPDISREDALSMPLTPYAELEGTAYIQEAKNTWNNVLTQEYILEKPEGFLNIAFYIIKEDFIKDSMERASRQAKNGVNIISMNRYFPMELILSEYDEILKNQQEGVAFSDGTETISDHLKRLNQEVELLDKNINLIDQAEKKYGLSTSSDLFNENVPLFSFNDITLKFIKKTFFYQKLRSTENSLKEISMKNEIYIEEWMIDMLKKAMDEADPVGKSLRLRVMERNLFYNYYSLDRKSSDRESFNEYICSHDNTEYYCNLFNDEFSTEKCLERCPGTGGFSDDFESGTDKWNFGNEECPLTLGCWKTVQEGNNLVLEGKEHSWANAKNVIREINSFTTNFKMIKGGAHFNFITNDEGRYYVSIGEDTVGLHRQINKWDTFKVLKTSDDLMIPVDQWSEIKIIVDYAEGEDMISVYVADEEVLTYMHDIIYDSGHVAFETLDSSHFYFDDVVVE